MGSSYRLIVIGYEEEPATLVSRGELFFGGRFWRNGVFAAAAPGMAAEDAANAKP